MPTLWVGGGKEKFLGFPLEKQNTANGKRAQQIQARFMEQSMLL